MAKVTNSSDYLQSFEYYYDYEDFVSFDGSELKANKYSIVICFWVSLAVFVVFMFLILLYMSRTDSARAKYTARTNVSPACVVERVDDLGENASHSGIHQLT
ncbi:melanocortin-2 receptor accessory protein [Ascaphus truei]|uniref:melanocortin-2 receptor accessory protein n=1 Tax=Ascaphus truei TaxID=8439 RepID=UPI003F5A8B66